MHDDIAQPVSMTRNPMLVQASARMLMDRIRTPAGYVVALEVGGAEWVAWNERTAWAFNVRMAGYGDGRLSDGYGLQPVSEFLLDAGR